MSAVRAAARPSGPPPASYVMPTAIAVAVLSLSLLLLAIGARSPYTHGNLARGYSSAYDRTAQIRVGEVEPFTGIAGAGSAGAPGATAVSRGARLYVTEGCATCHGLAARGGPVGPAIVGTDAATIAKRTHTGPGGMPQFSSSALTQADIDAIAAYLASLASATTGN